MIAREGYTVIAAVAAAAGLIVLVGLWLGPIWRIALAIVAVGLLGFALFFFRDPERTPPPEALNGKAVLAPADGRVVAVVEEEEPLYLEGTSRRVSIFLSPLNVHVNRIPANGVIEYARYRPGDYLVAWHPKASAQNERSELGLRHPSGTKVLFKQIAGAVARRIVYHVSEGDTVRVGERFGIVKFGSRMDVHVPLHVEIDVTEGQSVRAGETIIGRLVDTPAPAADAAAGASARQPAAHQ